jgi:hypothetical protein
MITMQERGVYKDGVVPRPIHPHLTLQAKQAVLYNETVRNIEFHMVRRP